MSETQKYDGEGSKNKNTSSFEDSLKLATINGLDEKEVINLQEKYNKEKNEIIKKSKLILKEDLEKTYLEKGYSNKGKDISLFLNDVFSSKLKNGLSIFNEKKFSSLDNNEGFSEYELSQFKNKIDIAIKRMELLGSYEEFKKSHENATDYSMGWDNSDKFLAKRADMNNVYIPFKGNINVTESIFDHLNETLGEGSGISEEELKLMREKKFDITSLDRMKEFFVLLGIEIGEGIQDIVKMLLNFPAGVILSKRYIENKIKIEGKVDTAEEVRLKIENERMLEENPSLALIELASSGGEIMSQLWEQMKTGNNGVVAMGVVSIVGLLAGGAGAAKLVGKGARIAGKTAKSSKVGTISKIGKKVENIGSKVAEKAGKIGEKLDSIDNTITTGGLNKMRTAKLSLFKEKLPNEKFQNAKKGDVIKLETEKGFFYIKKYDSNIFKVIGDSNEKLVGKDIIINNLDSEHYMRTGEKINAGGFSINEIIGGYRGPEKKIYIDKKSFDGFGGEMKNINNLSDGIGNILNTLAKEIPSKLKNDFNKNIIFPISKIKEYNNGQINDLINYIDNFKNKLGDGYNNVKNKLDEVKNKIKLKPNNEFLNKLKNDLKLYETKNLPKDIPESKLRKLISLKLSSIDKNLLLLNKSKNFQGKEEYISLLNKKYYELEEILWNPKDFLKKNKDKKLNYINNLIENFDNIPKSQHAQEILNKYQDLKPTKGIEIDGNNYLFGKINKGINGGRDQIIGFVEINGKFEPRFFYKSKSDGGWRGEPSDGLGYKKGNFIENYSYTITTKLDSKVENTINSLNEGYFGEGVNLNREFKNGHSLIQNFYNESKSFNDNGKLKVFTDKGEPGNLKLDFKNDSLDDIKSHMRNLKYPDGFIPEFNRGNIGEYKLNHTIAGKTNIEVFEGNLNGKKVEWHMAQSIDNPKQMWISNIRLKDSQINSFGTDSVFINSGILTNKPFEYYISQLPDCFKDGRPIVEGEYFDITDVIGELKPIMEYKEYLNKKK